MTADKGALMRSIVADVEPASQSWNSLLLRAREGFTVLQAMAGADDVVKEDELREGK